MFEYIYTNHGEQQHADCVKIDQHGRVKIKIKIEIESNPIPKYFEYYFVGEEEKLTIIEEIESKLDQVCK